MPKIGLPTPNCQDHSSKPHYSVQETKIYRASLEYLRILNQASKTAKARGVLGISQESLPKLIVNALEMAGSAGKLSTLSQPELFILHRLNKDLGVFNESEVVRLIPLVLEMYNN